MYLLNGEMWPHKDPITNRDLCHACWNIDHAKCGKMHTLKGEIVCDHFTRNVKGKCDCEHECDCHHLSEATFADIEKQRVKDAKKERRKMMADALKESPLRASKEIHA